MDFTDFDKLKLKVYDNWDLFLHVNQYPYIGRAYAWAKRDNATVISDMNNLERDELFDKIIPEWEKAVKKLFKHDTTNIACLGNTARHLHWHFIPRYNSPRTFRGVEFNDPNPNGNYAPYPKKDLDLSLIFDIKENIADRLKIDYK